ncbi:MAG: hypothetical protein K9M96_08955 [Deltaproteobacteria bacterium]|nr:hypothetical protein [Deltaproteobacteria bacterium]
MSTKSSYVYLAIAFLLMVVSNWAYTIPLAAWLYPVFLMRFMRTEKMGRSLLGGGLCCVAAGVLMCGWALSNEMLFSPSFRIMSGVAAGLLAFLPFAADRLVTRRIPAFASTLVFPMAFTTMELLMSFDGYRSTWGSLAYTQYGNLPLVQVVSLTGIWGVTFLMAWFASAINWAWQKGVHHPRVKRGLLLYAGVLGAVLLAGGARLALCPADGETTRVAAITKPKVYHALFPLSETRQSLCADSLSEQAYFLDTTRKAAAQGARIILWQEMGVFIRSEDEVAFIRNVQQVAREEKVYVAMTLCSFPEDYPASPWVNKMVLLDPTGGVLGEYIKARPSVLEPIEPGDGQIPVRETPYGKIAAVICCDATFPGLIRQAGRAGAGLLLVPGLVWDGVDPLYTRMNTFRAIENGFSFVQATGGGLSMAVDHQGRVWSAMDYGRTAPEIMTADIPIRHVETPYRQIGDLFGWLCVAGFIISVMFAVFRPSPR